MTGFAIMEAEVIGTMLRQIPLSAERIEAHLEACSLPGSIYEAPFGPVPLPAVERFISEISDRIGDPGFMFRCLDAELGSSIDAVASIPLPRKLTGLDSVYALAANIDACVTRAHFFCEIEGPRLWIRRTTGTTEWTASRPVELYNLQGMLSGMRRLFGPGMSPLALRLERLGPKRDLPEELRGIPILPADGALGMAFPLMEVAMSGVDPRRLFLASPVEARGEGDESDAGDLPDCLAMYLGAMDSRRLEDTMAGAFGMSPRSYRRHLARRGTSHRQLVENARLVKALELLADRSANLTEIAFDLGYSDRSHFTRFFTRRVGVSPHAYRQARLGPETGSSAAPETPVAARGNEIAVASRARRAYPYS